MSLWQTYYLGKTVPTSSLRDLGYQATLTILLLGYYDTMTTLLLIVLSISMSQYFYKYIIW